MIKAVSPINFKGTNLIENAKEQPKQESPAPTAAEQPQASGSEAMANYNKASIHPSQQIKPQIEEPKAEISEKEKSSEVKPQEKDDDKDEKDD